MVVEADSEAGGRVWKRDKTLRTYPESQNELRASKTSIDTSIDNVKRAVLSFVNGTKPKTKETERCTDINTFLLPNQ
jgi:hypothetical protein